MRNNYEMIFGKKVAGKDKKMPAGMPAWDHLTDL
jgi:hypothetical protein